MKDFFLEDGALISFRNVKEKEALIFFRDKIKNIQSICQKIKGQSIEKVYVYQSSQFKVVHSYIATMLVQPHFRKITELDSSPSYELTKHPQNKKNMKINSMEVYWNLFNLLIKKNLF